MQGDPTLALNQVRVGDLEYWYTLIRTRVKGEYLAALAHLAWMSWRTDKIPLARQQLVEVDRYAITLRAFILAAEERATHRERRLVA